MRRSILPVVALAALAALAEVPQGWAAGSRPVLPDSSVIDSARAEMEVGRHWHAALLLEPVLERGGLDLQGVLLLARARAGYRSWSGVADLLEEPLARGELRERREILVLAGRARAALGRHGAAAEAFAAALDGAAPDEAGVLGVLRARALHRDGRSGEARAALDGIDDEALRSWLALEWLTDAVEAGDTAAVAGLLGAMADSAAADRAWHARARAFLTAGDTARALDRYAILAGQEASPARRAIAWSAIGEILQARGDDSGALEAFGNALDLDVGGGRAREMAARGVLELGSPGADRSLAIARILDRAGDGRGALDAYDRHVERAAAEGMEADAAARVERARLMATVPERQEEAVVEYRALSTHPDPAVGSRALVLWAGLRRRQGRTGDEATLRRWLLERYPRTAAAAEIVFFRGDAAHDRLDHARALEEYRRVAGMAPAVDFAGLARMRSGQIHLERGETAAAAETFEAYLEDFPRGRRWEEATYWAARSRMALGDTATSLDLLDRLRREEPFSYYTVLTADLLGEPYELDLPPGPEAAAPDWLAGALAEVDRLRGAGLDAGVEQRIEALTRRARDEGAPALLSAAEALSDRGRTLDAINLGWEVRRQDEPWSDRLVRLVYPFPHREMVEREAREWGVDPILLAALIRQESAWMADIVSSAGAVGLMQVMPATGRGLARAVGPADFTTESLETPEVNLHLGARFLVDLMERFGPDLPLVLSAYNAGPTRAVRWRSFPEISDPLRFTERIPFAETRGYVKNVTRNHRLYGALYGAEARVAR